jgi:hypothetical protein
MRRVSGAPCPRCGASRLHRSRSLAPVRWLARFVGLRRYRCRSCGYIGWRRRPHEAFASTPKLRRRLFLLTGIVVAVGALAGLSVVYLTGAP